jgi:hypothetical protein
MLRNKLLQKTNFMMYYSVQSANFADWPNFIRLAEALFCFGFNGLKICRQAIIEPFVSLEGFHRLVKL